MSLPDVTPIVSYQGNGDTVTAYPFLFKVLDASHVKLYLDGVLSADAITVTGVGDDAGVQVTTSVAYASGVRVTLLREVPFSQETDLVEGGRLREESLEDALDYGVMQAQQLNEELGRTIQVAPGSAGSTLPSATDSTIGQDANGDLVSRTAEEQAAHLGLGSAVTEAAASAAAAATSETNAATSETNAAASEVAAEASNVNASAALFDLASKSFPTTRIGKDIFQPNLNSDLTITFPGGGSLTLKASARPYTEPNAINAEGGFDVSLYLGDIINIINGDVTDYDTNVDHGLGIGSTTVSNFTPIPEWSAKLATDRGEDLDGFIDITYYGSEQTTFTVPLPLEVKANADLAPPEDLPFAKKSTINSGRFGGYTPLINLPTFDDNPSVTHPDVIEPPNGFLGYKYVMAYTPFPNAARENPEIAFSQNGYDWVKHPAYTDLTAPLVSYSEVTSTTLGATVGGWAADTHLAMLPNGNLACYFIIAQLSGGTGYSGNFMVEINADGTKESKVATTPVVTSLDSPRTGNGSPSIIQEEDGTYTMFGTDSRGDGLDRWTSADGTSFTWQDRVTFNNYDHADFKIWHANVKKVAGRYHALLFDDQPRGSDFGVDGVPCYYAYSDNGTSWFADHTKTAVQPTGNGDGYGFYRSAFLPTYDSQGDLKWKVWMSCIPNYDSYTTLPAWPSLWVTATSYTVGDYVEQDDVAYKCLITHTSGVFATDLAGANWEVSAAHEPWLISHRDNVSFIKEQRPLTYEDLMRIRLNSSDLSTVAGDWAVFTNSGGSANTTESKQAGLYLTTGSDAASWVFCKNLQNNNAAPYAESDNTNMRWSNDLELAYKFKIVTNNANTIFQSQLGNFNNSHQSPTDLITSGFGFKVVNSSVFVVAHDGSTLVETDTGVNVTATDINTLRLRSRGANSVEWYINGVTGATTHGPKNVLLDNRHALSVWAENDGVNTGAGGWIVSKAIITNLRETF